MKFTSRRHNQSKSNIITFSNYLFSQHQFTLSGKPLTVTDRIEYLGIEILSNLDFNSLSINKFQNVYKSLFSLT